MNEQIVPLLKVKDAAAALPWYERMGFTEQWVHRFEPGFPAFMEIARGQMRLFLSEHEGDAPREGSVYLFVRDVDAVAAEFGAAAEDTAWGTREVELRDPDGNRLRIGRRLRP
ncbi:VOC family protein [Glycomyces tarimensis]